jgi:hypothetical protein
MRTCICREPVGIVGRRHYSLNTFLGIFNQLAAVLTAVFYCAYLRCSCRSHLLVRWGWFVIVRMVGRILNA